MTITFLKTIFLFQFPETPGLHGWSWEVAVTYTDTLADICLHGDTSTIQKTALVGNNTDLSLLHTKSAPQCPMRSAGLLDLAYFKGLHEKQDKGRFYFKLSSPCNHAITRFCDMMCLQFVGFYSQGPKGTVGS